MFAWVSNSLILTYWGKIDSKLNRRFVDSVTDSINIWLNGLVASGDLLGGRVEVLEAENSDVEIMSGKITLHVYLTPPSPAEEIEFLLEYDPSYLSTLF
ncbi:hypothetical protein FACS1894217_07130 [Clostridia bacterium]|nr:hypothetical protein FACS1894217_07130 [Clostridia bacterium]